ncbi:MAG: restriction endonuclease subunit S, partial [[Clostridium] innocuum]|nr:restriction endonuclease subunit S [[Clostridium] innocuum]
RKKVKHIYFKSFIDNADIINTHNYFTSYSEFFMMKYYVPYLIRKESGTVFGSVNKNDINNLEVDIPSNEDIQKNIARFLEMIDDKIELNSTINNNLVAYRLMYLTSTYKPLNYCLEYDQKTTLRN